MESAMMSQDKLSEQEKVFWRANTYHLLARLLNAPPDRTLVSRLGEIPPPGDQAGAEPVAMAWGALGEAARRAREEELTREFERLVEGKLHAHVAKLSDLPNGEPPFWARDEWSKLDIEKNGSADELCKIMHRLVESGDPLQIGFFTRCAAPWLNSFFRELREARSANFYRAVGELGEAFLEVERIYLRKVY
jgi:TorA maturation chaperone TorD